MWLLLLIAHSPSSNPCGWSEFSLPAMCDRMNMNMICWYYVLLARGISLDFYEKPLPPKPISVLLTWWVSFNRLANATMVTWCAYHVHMGFAAVWKQPNLRWADACKRDVTRNGVESRQHNKQDIMEEEAYQQLYRRPQMTGQAREEEDWTQRMS